MLKQTTGPTSATHLSDFAPSLDSEPVFERPAEGRWDIAPKPDPFAPFDSPAAGPWADTRSAFDLEATPGPGFLDPGTHALLNHVAPLMASEAMPFGALAWASGDLQAPLAAAGGSPALDGSGGTGDEDDDAGVGVGVGAPPPPRAPRKRK